MHKLTSKLQHKYTIHISFKSFRSPTCSWCFYQTIRHFENKNNNFFFLFFFLFLDGPYKKIPHIVITSQYCNIYKHLCKEKIICITKRLLCSDYLYNNWTYLSDTSSLKQFSRINFTSNLQLHTKLDTHTYSHRLAPHLVLPINTVSTFCTRNKTEETQRHTKIYIITKHTLSSLCKEHNGIPTKALP